VFAEAIAEITSRLDSAKTDGLIEACALIDVRRQRTFG